MTQTQVSKEYQGFKWELMIPSNIDTEINEGRDWEPCVSAWIRGRLKKGDVAVDVGANIGWFTLLMSRQVGPEGEVIAFEPEPSFRERLKTHLEINQIENVLLSPFALSNEECVARIIQNIGPYHSSAIMKYGPETEGIEVRCKTLDYMCDPLWIGKVALIKIDIDGNELKMLKGAQQTIDKSSPFIAMEIGDKGPAEFLEGMGYNLSREVSSIRHSNITAAQVPSILTPGMPTINIFGVRK